MEFRLKTVGRKYTEMGRTEKAARKCPPEARS